MNNQNLALPQTGLILFIHQPLANLIRIGVLLSHDEKHRFRAECCVGLVVLAPALQGSKEPFSIYIGHIVLGDLIRVGALNLMDHERCLDDAVFHRLG